MSARHTHEDYAAAAMALRPRGRVWPLDPDSQQGDVFRAIGRSFERSDEAASNLLDQSLPGKNEDLLVEWEESLGLPDPCAGPSPTVPQRQAQVLARFTGVGGQNRQRYIDYAALLGFTIEIINYTSFRVGKNHVGDPLAGDNWNFTWGVHILANTGGLSSDVLKCELEAIKPAETIIIIS